MLYKIGTVSELEAIKSHIHPRIYDAALPIVSMLDKEYGADRDIDQADGGYVLLAETIEDARMIQKEYQDMAGSSPEEATVISADRAYIHALYLRHNEFGLNIILPVDIVSDRILKEV